MSDSIEKLTNLYSGLIIMDMEESDVYPKSMKSLNNTVVRYFKDLGHTNLPSEHPFMFRETKRKVIIALADKLKAEGLTKAQA